LKQPAIVKRALTVWLESNGFDEPEADMVSPWLEWWFDNEAERLPEEENNFVEQMCRIARFMT
jgi:hypothetical protein